MHCKKIGFNREIETGVSSAGIRRLIEVWLDGRSSIEQLNYTVQEDIDVDLETFLPADHECLPRSRCGRVDRKIEGHEMKRSMDGRTLLLDFEERYYSVEVSLQISDENGFPSRLKR